MRAILISLAIIASARAQMAPFDPETDAVAIADKGEELLSPAGICVGITDTNAFSVLPGTDLIDSFGATVAGLFGDKTAAVNAKRLTRIFTVLGNETSYLDWFKGIPLLYTQSALDRWNLFAVKISQPSRAQVAATTTEIDAQFDRLQKNPEDAAIASVAVMGLAKGRPGILLEHSIFIYAAESVDSHTYRFRYADPDFPRMAKTLTYDRITNRTRFDYDVDGQRAYFLLRLYSVKAASAANAHALREIEIEHSARARRILAFLGLPGSDDESRCYYHDCLFNPDLFEKWYAMAKREEPRDLLDAIHFAGRAQLDRSQSAFDTFVGYLGKKIRLRTPPRS